MNNRSLFILSAIVALFLICFLILLGISRLFFNQFSLTSTSPRNNKIMEEPGKALVFKFNREIQATPDLKANVSSSPVFLFSPEIKGKEIILNHSKRLVEGVVYSIVLSDVKSKEGETLRSVSLVFTVRENSKRGDFIRSLPIKTSNFTISYLKDDGSFFVQILQLPADESKNKAIEFMKSKGIDTQNETIIFEVLRSLRGDGAPPG